MNRGLAGAVIACMAVTLVGLAVLWPSRSRLPVPPGIGGPTHLISGTVSFTRSYSCRYTITPNSANAAPSQTKQTDCETSQITVHNGPDRGQQVSVDTNSGAGTASLHTGDRVLLTRDVGPDNKAIYEFVDFQRGQPLAWLGVIFAMIVVAVARWRGIGALIGLGVTWLVLVRFLLPALLDGRNAFGVALVASALILCLVLFIAHGLNARTATALLGTLASLLLVGVLGLIAIAVTRLSGLATEEAPYLQTVSGVQLRGLLLAGMVIGSLGVLNDMTVTQASAVWELHLANPAQSLTGVYRSAMRIGRDHIASTVYTLVLAYAGAALPLLLSFDLAGRHFSDVVTSEIVAEEVVRTLVGSIGLVACVPLTTILAAAVVTAARRHQSDPDIATVAATS
ncbi:MAG: YibE/F family protein [Acidimicrobiales bacterium]